MKLPYAPFSKLLIANRGEIAVRIAASARALGHATVAVFSDADRGAPHVACCDEAIHIGPTPAADSYLSIDRILEAAARCGAEAVHPGYGFLAENAGFARACRDAGLVFVGPGAEAIELAGDKARAKARMSEAGVPCVPGYAGGDQSAEAFARAAEEIGYPLLVKAVAGGGGRGMRRVDGAGALPEALERARSEAESAFGNGDLLLEKLLSGARHVEIQIFGDHHGRMIHLGERDCSVQRRHQKVIEESPSPTVDAGLRARMGAAAVDAGRALGYAGAGTVEFLLDAGGEFHFIEVNARLQVEHPVTELRTGLDLVAWQLRVAAGEPLPLAQDEVAFRGHVIEARLYAEDPTAGFAPRPGRLVAWESPAGVRVDHGLASGGEIPAAYEALLAKLVAHGKTRSEARRRLLLALADAVVFGPTTNRRFLAQALRHPVFGRGAATTSFLDDETSPRDFAPPPPRPEVLALAAILLSQPGLEDADGDDLRSWHGSGRAGWGVELTFEDGAAGVRVEPAGGSRYRVEAGGETTEIEILSLAHGRIRFEVDGLQRKVAWRRDGDGLWLDDELHARRFGPRARGRRAEAAGDGRIVAPMSGRIREVLVAPGDACEPGQALLVLEAMKLETPVASPVAGVVEEVRVKAGEQVAQRQLLMVLERPASSRE